MSFLKKDENYWDYNKYCTMKTKFILHGGFNPALPMEDDAFFSTILENTNQTPKILLVFFAKEEDRIPKNEKEDISQFEKNKKDKTLYFESADEENFIKQIQEADVIYFHGGKSSKLVDTLKQFSNLKEALEGKTVVGDSAGANALSTYYFGNHDNKIFEGIGVIPIKVFCHYSDERENQLQELKEYRPELEFVKLTEYETQVVEF